MKKHTLKLAPLVALTLVSNPANAAVISGTGYSVDAIVEAGAASVDDGASYAGFARWVLAEDGAPNQGPGVALPAGGLVTTQNGTTFQIPSYTGPNTLVNGDTFTLDSAGSFTDIQFFITGIGGNSANNFVATLNFSDATTTDLQFSVADWQGSRDYNAFADKTAYVRRGGTQNISLWTRELTFDLDLADQGKILETIDFALSDRLGLSAVSGTPLAVPEPSSLVLLGLGGLALIRRRRAQEVL